MINDVGVVAGNDDGGVPVEAVFLQVAGFTKSERRPDHHVAFEARLDVILADDPLVASAVHVARPGAVEGQVGALAAGHRCPLAHRDAKAVAAALRAYARVVLLAAVDVVRFQVIDIHAIELRGGLVVLRTPTPGAIHGDRRTAIIGIGEDLRVARVDPEAMIVAMGRVDDGKGLAAVDGAGERRVDDPDDVGILRVGHDVGVVPGARADQPVIAEPAPALAGVIRAVEPAIFSLDDGEHAVGIRRRNRHVNLAHELGKPLGQAHPGVAGVGGLPDARARTARTHLPWRTLMIPEGGVQDAGIRGIEREAAGAAGAVAPLEHQRPRLASVH